MFLFFYIYIEKIGHKETNLPEGLVSKRGLALQALKTRAIKKTSSGIDDLI